MNPVTTALRDGTRQGLERELVDTLISGQSEWAKDVRDLWVVLAAFHDCARRLGLDPAGVFASAADKGPPSLRETVREFGARSDVTLPAFGWKLESAPDGPYYRSTLIDGVDLAGLEQLYGDGP